MSLHFRFSSPEYLAALLLVPLVYGFAVVIRRRRPRYVVMFTNIGVLPGLAAKRHSTWWRRPPIVLLALGLLTAAAALARPHMQLTASNRTATIMLLVDISSSMQAHDVGQQRVGIGESRLEAAVTAMHDFLQAVPSNDKIGLATFSDKVQVLVPPTTDHGAVDSALNVLSPQGGTALGAGLATAVKILVSSLAASGYRHAIGTYAPAAIVLESDGAQNRGTITPAAGGELANTAGIRIYGVALGRRDGYVTQGSGFSALKIPVPPDPGIVALLARQTGGKAYTAITGPALDRIYRHLGSTVGSRPQVTEITSWFEVAAAVLLLSGLTVARARGGALP